MTNAESIAVHMAGNPGGPAPQIHEIPRTGLWLVAEPCKNSTWKLFVCNPFMTSRRLVTHNPIDTHVYTAIWAKLILHPAVDTAITRAAAHYKKHFAKYYKNYTKSHKTI